MRFLFWLKCFYSVQRSSGEKQSYDITVMMIQARLYFPQMCNMKTQAMKSKDITKTGTGPTLIPGESSVQNLHIPPELVPPARVAGAVVVLRCLTVPLLPAPALGEAAAALGDLPTEVALAAGPG